MAHVTFIHGIANKPAPDALLRLWRRSLAHENGLDLGAEGVTSSMVYWADVMYEKPEEESAAFESNEACATKNDEDIDLSWREKIAGEEKSWVDDLAGTLNFDASEPEGDEDFEPPESKIGIEFERVPLPWWLKRRIMKAFLRDVHHYLFNAKYSPRPGVSYRVQDEIRQRMITKLKEGAEKSGPHIVVSHSMGTVIAYDCLKRIPECPRVDALITIGSPLGLDEVQDKLQPGWTRDQGFPQDHVSEKWINVFDRLDPVAGFDPEIANDYRRSGERVIKDIHEPNWGKWRHNITKYLSGTKLRSELTAVLGL